MNIMLETNPTISKEEIMSWIEAPYVCGYNRCGSCHISQFEKENAELKAQNEKLKCCGNCKHVYKDCTKEKDCKRNKYKH